MSRQPTRVVLAVTALTAMFAHSALAQFDPQAQVEITVLRAELRALESRMNRQEGELAALRLEMQKNSNKQLLENVGLRAEIAGINAMLGSIVLDINALKARQPAEPGNKPADPSRPADGQVLSLRAPFIVKDGSGRVVFKVDVAAGNLPRAIVGNPTGSRVELGIGAGGASVVGLYDESNKMLSTLVADSKGSYLRVKDNEQSSSFGKVEGFGLGLFMLKDDKSFAEISSDQKGFGLIRVFGTDGKAVGGLFAGAEGGGLALTPAGGGKSAVSLAVTSTGGKVRVFAPGGGKTRAELIADGATGAVNIFDSDGGTAVNVASVQSKAGKIEISNGQGDIVVQAGAQKNGRGMVTTGPFEGGWLARWARDFNQLRPSSDR